MIAASSEVHDLQFVPVTLRGREAMDAAKYLGDGSRVSITGHLHTALVIDRDAYGIKHARRIVHVIADRVTYLTVVPPRGGERPSHPEDRQ